MMRDANAGRIQGGFMDYPIAASIIAKGAYPNLKMAKSYEPIVVGSLGIATRKEDTELLARIDKALTKLKADGTIDGILKKWNLAD